MTPPKELRDLPQWVIWHREMKEGRWTKVPYCSRNPEKRASSTNPEDWSTFEFAESCTSKNKTGVGFVFNGNGIMGIDLDHALGDGVLTKFQDIFEKINSYTEITPSGTGLHIIFQCEEVFETGRKKGDLEIYSKGRFFTFTGNVYQGRDKIIPVSISTVREAITPYLEKIVKKPLPLPVKTMDDDDIIKLASAARNSVKFTRLYHGDSSGYPSQSEAESALASILLFYTEDCTQISRIMQSSGLYREKMGREDYLTRTIDHARGIVTEHYERPREIIRPMEKKESVKIDTTSMDNPRLKVDLPNNFVEDYINYMHGLSDSYLEYQHGAAIMLLSLAVNKRAYLPLTIGTIYPNLWVFCLGQSTISRKTTACTKLTEFIELQNQWMILSYPGSPEAFVEDLEGVDRVLGPDNIGHGILCRDEAAGILSAMEKTYMSDMRDLFCQLYDCHPFIRRLRSGQRKAKTVFNIKDAYLNFFFATTPDNFSTHTKLEDMTSGWLLRFLYYYPNYERKMRDLGSMTDKDRALQNAIGKQIKSLMSFFNNHTVEFQLSIAGQSFYNTWKRDHLQKMQHDRQEDRGMFDRLSIYALKLSMLYTIGQKSVYDELTPDRQKTLKMDISDDCLSTACSHIDEYFYPISKIVFDTVGRCEDKNIIEKILGTVRRAGGKISRVDLMKRAHVKKKDLDDGLDALLESTELKVYTDGGLTCYCM